MRRFIASAMLGAAFIGAAFAASRGQAAENGSSLYDQECAECHSLRPGKTKKGPSLIGITDKPAAQVPGFVYSPALKSADIVWTRERLDAYIADPRKVVHGGGKMKYDGLEDAARRAAIIDFLTEQH
jgi:cytochrome c2